MRKIFESDIIILVWRLRARKKSKVGNLSAHLTCCKDDDPTTDCSRGFTQRAQRYRKSRYSEFDPDLVWQVKVAVNYAVPPGGHQAPGNTSDE